jgi:arsenate reductase
VPEQYNVLFLCTGNSARSIMAEAILNGQCAPMFRAYSAGSHPTGRVNPAALRQLEEARLSTEGLRSKSWEEFSRPDAPRLDFIFTVCDNAANEACPIWPGQPMTAHWGIPDHGTVQGTEEEVRGAFRDAFIMLERRISRFLCLPLKSLDLLAIKRELDNIGQQRRTGKRHEIPHTRLSLISSPAGEHANRSEESCR